MDEALRVGLTLSPYLGRAAPAFPTPRVVGARWGNAAFIFVCVCVCVVSPLSVFSVFFPSSPPDLICGILKARGREVIVTIEITPLGCEKPPAKPFRSGQARQCASKFPHNQSQWRGALLFLLKRAPAPCEEIRSFLRLESVKHVLPQAFHVPGCKPGACKGYKCAKHTLPSGIRYSCPLPKGGFAVRQGHCIHVGARLKGRIVVFGRVLRRGGLPNDA